MGTNSKSVAGKARSSRNEQVAMSETHHVPAILQPKKRARFLKLIAIFKILQGVLLLALGSSLFFLNSRTLWLEKISDWADEELLLHHSRAVLFLLNKLQDALAGGQLRATALLAFFYSAILFTEGFGVYFQKRWAEFLMVFATGALIPLEVRHIWHRPSPAAIIILLVNCFIVWFLYRILRRDAERGEVASEPEVARVG
jgi:uncharacterized membrane protein (DUF2068 family)